MSSDRKPNLSRSLAYREMAKNVNDTLWGIFQEGEFSDSAMSKISHSILSFSSESQAAIETDPRVMQIVLKEVSAIYQTAGLIFYKSRIIPKEGEIDAAEFSALISCLVDTVGIPENTVLVNLVGITKDLDHKITNSMIEHNLPLMAISIEERGYEEKGQETVNCERLESLISYLVKAGSHGSAIDLLDAMSLMHLHEPKHWPAPAMLDIGLSFFRNAPSLNDAEKNQLDRFFSLLKPQEINLFHVGASMDSVINLAKAGYLDVAEPILSSCHRLKDQFSIDTPLAFLTEVEKHTSIDVKNLYDEWLCTSRMDASDDESLSVVIGYHLLNAQPLVSANLVKYDAALLPILISKAVETYGVGVVGNDISVNAENLNKILSEVMVHNPSSISKMAKDPFLKEFVEASPLWPTHRLETELGL